MKKLLLLSLLTLSSLALAQPTTSRTTQLTSKRVDVWQTTIYPSKNQQLKLHRHADDRVVVALTNGILKVVTDQHKAHVWKLKSGHSYYLPKDPLNVKHTDENISGKPIKVIVVSLKQ